MQTNSLRYDFITSLESSVGGALISLKTAPQIVCFGLPSNPSRMPNHLRQKNDYDSQQDGQRRSHFNEIAELIAAGPVNQKVSVMANWRQERDYRSHGDRDHESLWRLSQSVRQGNGNGSKKRSRSSVRHELRQDRHDAK